MSEPEDFLTRWSRRKRAAAESESQEPGLAATPARESAPADPAASAQPAAKAEAEFDLSTLPSIDSIGPDTDMSVFMKPGVPASLRHAALRRVWVTDPAIRDFKGLQEYDWDFNSLDVPGFGELGPDVDVRKMVARLFGDKPKDEEAGTTAAGREPARTPDESTGDVAGGVSSESATDAMQQVATSSGEPELVRREENIASQQKEPRADSRRANMRRHGSALPSNFSE
jgi:hypothetical protein